MTVRLEVEKVNLFCPRRFFWKVSHANLVIVYYHNSNPIFANTKILGVEKTDDEIDQLRCLKK